MCQSMTTQANAAEGQGRVLAHLSRGGSAFPMSNESKLKAGKAAAGRLIDAARIRGIMDRESAQAKVGE